MCRFSLNPMLTTLVVSAVFLSSCNTSSSSSVTDPSKKVEWISVSDVTLSDLEPAGGERNNGATIYVARAAHQITLNGNRQSGIIPGKCVSTYKLMYYTHNGVEYTKNSYEVLSYPKGTVSWIPVDSVEFPEDLIVGGIDPVTNMVLYICRFFYFDQAGEKYLMTGKLLSSGECITSLRGTEIQSKTYEALVLNEYGKYINAL